MRKVLSLVLVLALVLGSFAFTFAATPSDVVGEDSEDAVNVLMGLGVLSGYPDGSFKPAGIVTRGEMAKIIICALGLEDYAAGRSSFSDMAGHWSDKYVAYAVSLGIINGYPDNTFKADNTVSYDEAAKMLVASLGYTEDSLVGSWPVNYVTKAKVLGILDDIKAGSAGANRGDIAIMTYQTLDQQIGKTNKDGDWAASAPVGTMLDRLGAVSFAAVVIDGSEASAINLRPYVGAFASVYRDGAAVGDDIIAIKEVESTFFEGEFEVAVDVTSNILANALFTTSDDAEYNLKAAIDTDTIEGFLNGASLGLGNAVAPATTYTIAAETSGTKITEIYSIMEWDVTQGSDFQFEDGDLEDDNLAGEMFVLDDSDEIDMDSFELLGVAKLEDIKEDHVVYVYRDGATLGTDEIRRIEVGTEVVNGTVTKINSAGTEVTVSGKTYELASASADGADWAGLDIEDEVDFYLDYAGDVYEIDVLDSEGENYAMVLETENYAGGLSSGNAMSVELFLADGTTKIFEVDDEYNDAGTLTDGAGNWNLPVSGTAGKVQATLLVEYGLDDDGVVDYIEAVAFHADSPGAATEELTSKGYYEGKIVASDAVMFTYEGTTAAHASDEDYYGVTTVAKATGKEFAAAYFVDSDKIVVMVTVGIGSGDVDLYGVATARAKTSASGTDYMLTMLVDGEEVEYEIVKAEYDKFGGGTYNMTTVYEITTNANDEITGLKTVDGDADADTNYLAPTTANTPKLATAFSNSVLTVGGTKVTIDSDAMAIKFNADDEVFEASSPTKGNMVNNYVKLIDLDGDTVADLVMIDEDAFVFAEAQTVVAIPAGATNGTQAAGTIVLPAVGGDYTIAVKTTTGAARYDATGKIQADGVVTVVFTVTHTASKLTADTAAIKFTVDVL